MFNVGKSINFESNIPYYIQLIEVLKEKISKGEWKPNDQLPSEPELCSLYGVSRTVVRQALREIELEGLIIRRKGKGTFVAEPKINESLVQRLTGFYQDMVDRGHKPITKVLMFEVQPASSKVSKYLGLESGTPVFCIERLRYVQDEPILLVTTYIPYAICPRLEEYDLSNQSLYAVLEKEFGLVISHGRRTIEAVTANEREALLLRVEENDPLLLLDSVTYLEDGTPIEYYHAIHRGDRSRFEVELVRIRDQRQVRKTLATEVIDLPASNAMQDLKIAPQIDGEP
jgi:GntR family transcriptional regulator